MDHCARNSAPRTLLLPLQHKDLMCHHIPPLAKNNSSHHSAPETLLFPLQNKNLMCHHTTLRLRPTSTPDVVHYRFRRRGTATLVSRAAIKHLPAISFRALRPGISAYDPSPQSSAVGPVGPVPKPPHPGPCKGTPSSLRGARLARESREQGMEPA